jgi:hypothetical protein
MGQRRYIDELEKGYTDYMLYSFYNKTKLKFLLVTTDIDHI